MVRQEGRRVLLIDADLRSPRVHTLLGAPSSPGLADYLQGDASEFEVIQRGHEEGLYFTPAGTHVTHPSELISSGRMKEFLDRVKPEFDWIIIDSSPVLPVADATVLAGLCDGVLLVIRANNTPSETARKACREFQDAHILGVVLNTVDKDSAYGSYYSSGAYGAPPTRKSKK
jgi:capsular exopolysaccharide synthesis family protein